MNEETIAVVTAERDELRKQLSTANKLADSLRLLLAEAREAVKWALIEIKKSEAERTETLLTNSRLMKELTATKAAE